MKRFLLLSLIAVAPVFAQPTEPPKEHEKAATQAKEAAEGEENLSVWKWANFAILAAGLGYLAAKSLGALFKSRSEEISKGISDAQQVKVDAEKRAADIDKRVSALGSEIEKIRAHSATEMQREGERIRQETAAAIGKVEQQGMFEIESAGKLARRELKEYAATIAMNLAEERIRARMDAGTENALIENFVSDLGRQGSKN